jgi:hypothetical protein
MNQLDALKKMCDHYPGGRAAIALRLGKSDEVLRKELSGDPKFKMGVIDATAISAMCIEANSAHCNAYATAVAANCGGFVALEVREMGGKQDLRSDMAGMLKECTDAVVVLTAALADESISDNERREIERELADLFAKAQDVLQGTQARNVAGKPMLRAAA